jgi:hypothetical protein
LGTRWRIRGRTFAHVLAIESGWPPAYALAAATDGPATVLTFRSSGPELGVLRGAGRPFFAVLYRRVRIFLITMHAPAFREAFGAYPQFASLASHVVLPPRPSIEGLGIEVRLAFMHFLS